MIHDMIVDRTTMGILAMTEIQPQKTREAIVDADRGIAAMTRSAKMQQ
jgi:hypothetical protein